MTLFEKTTWALYHFFGEDPREDAAYYRPAARAVLMVMRDDEEPDSEWAKKIDAALAEADDVPG